MLKFIVNSIKLPNALDYFYGMPMLTLQTAE